MSIKPTGGRGKKAPYNSTIVRIPDPLLDQVNCAIALFRESVISNESGTSEDLKHLSSLKHSKIDAINLAVNILQQKKSARVSLSKLLQVLYADTTINL